MADSSRKLLRFPKSRDRRPRPPGQMTAFELDGSILRAVLVATGNRVQQAVAVPLELPADADRTDPAVVGKALAKAVAALPWKPSTVVVGIPRGRVMLRTLILPATGQAGELASLVHFQAGRDLPFRADQAIIDFLTCRELPPAPTPALPADPAGGATPPPLPAGPARVEILVAIIKAEDVTFQQRLAEVAGYKLAGLGLLPVGHARMIGALPHVTPGSATALVTVRPDEVGVDVVVDGSLLFSRGAILRPTAEGAAPSATTVIEVVRTLHGYAGHGANPPVTRLFLAGATAPSPELAEALAQRLGIPCTPIQATTDLGVEAAQAPAAVAALGALGLAAAGTDEAGLRLDFLNPKRPPIPRDLRRLRILAGIAAAVLLLVGVFVVRSILVERRDAVLKGVQAELTDGEKKRPTYRRMVQQAAVINDWIKGGRDWLDHAAYLTSVLPPAEELYVTSLTISGQGGIRLAVQARSGETLARLEKQLRNAGYDVRPLAITPGADRFGYEFRSNVELGVPDKLKIDLQKVKPPLRPLDDISLEPAAYRRTGG